MPEATEGKAQQQISIYRMEPGRSLSALAETVLSQGYNEQELNEEPAAGYVLRLFYQSYKFTPRWRSFLQPIVREDQKILATKDSAQQNYVLFLQVSDTANIYAITGGYGHNVIREYTNNDFGLDILSRVIHKEDKVLKAARERNFVGGIMGSTKYFRNTFNLFENESFGTIYQELRAAVERELLLNNFGFSEEELSRGAFCTAKSSFRINKAIDFQRLLTIVAACEDISTRDPIISINDVRKLTKRKHAELIDALDKTLFHQLWSAFQNANVGYSFDLCHSDFERYLTARSYRVMIHRQRRVAETAGTTRRLVNYFDGHEFETLNNIDDIFAKMKKDINIKNEQHFSNQLSALRICSYDDDGNELTRGDLLSHIMGDVTQHEEKYFFVDKVWYEITQTFIENLDASCKSFIHNYRYDGMLKTWNTVTHQENDYNAEYIGDDCTLVLDKVTAENIELCDIAKWDNNDLYLVHVKAGFGNTIRDLCAQITIAANRLSQDRSAIPPKTFVKNVYRALCSKKDGVGYFARAGDQTDSITEEDFLALFDRNVHFVLAILDSGQTERDLRNIEEFHSSIAKFSLHALTKDMAGINQSLRVCQIRKAQAGSSGVM